MDKSAARTIVKDTFQNSFQKDRFYRFAKELLNRFEDSPFVYRGNYIPDAYEPYVQTLERIGKYQDPDGKKIDLLIATLKKESSLEHARTMQRNFIAWYLNGSRGGELKDAALVAFVAPDSEDWRFSLVKMEYKIIETPSGRVKAKEEFTPARRFSFLVGKNESTHTAQSRLAPLLEDEVSSPTLEALQDSFNIETVTREFFEKYRELYLLVKETLDTVLKKDSSVREDFRAKGVNTVDFTKKLLGQIVFLYFLQKKGWFGVKRKQNWGTGSKHFLRELFDKKHADYNNCFNDILEPLFYEALGSERPDDYYSRFDCRIPFLNGGLFDPINNYDWIDTDIRLPNTLFSNTDKTEAGDTGTGILDVFDRYNFTVKEDEPLEKEVAVDPEMLGKVFENLLEVKDRKSQGTYYTPRDVVHYMCQESLTTFLARELDGKVGREDIATLLKYGETVIEHDTRVQRQGRETKTYSYKLPASIRDNAETIDMLLSRIRICDPAVGSGAFPVGMMGEVIRARSTLTPYISENNGRTLYAFKRHAVENSLYGVDIDAGAVEIAKLRLWLSLIVDEEDIKQIQPLPNLDYKIVQGDSLLRVEHNLFNQQQFADLERLKPLYFNETNARKKQKYKDTINGLISQLTNKNKTFDFEVYFSEVFHEKGGFDVVIANPPYVSALEFGRTYTKDYRKLLGELFAAAQGAYDVYVLFFERGLKLLRPGGNLAFISPNKYLSARYAVGLRELILKTAAFAQIVDLSAIDVFSTAAVYPVLTFLIAGAPLATYTFSAAVPKHRRTAEFDLDSFISTHFESKILTLLPENIWGFLLSTHAPLLAKLIGNARPLTAFGQVNASTTAAEADAFTTCISESRDGQSLKVINTGTIDKFKSLWGIVPMTHAGHRFLTPYIRLNCKAVNDRRRALYGSPKLIFAKMARECEAFLDSSGEYASVNTNCFYAPNDPADLEYIAAFCNSRLFMFIYGQFFGALRMSGGYYQFQAPQLRVVPVRTASVSQKRRIGQLVDQICADKRKEDQRRTLLAEIDSELYKMYGLSKADIDVVEASN